MANNETVNTQIRLPAGLHEYIQKEAGRLGIANNAFLVILCELGGKVWDANKRLTINPYEFILGKANPSEDRSDR